MLKILLILLLLTGCAKDESCENCTIEADIIEPVFKETSKVESFSEYSRLKYPEVLNISSFTQMLKDIENGEEKIYFVSTPDCEHCQKAIEILGNVAHEKNITVENVDPAIQSEQDWQEYYNILEIMPDEFCLINEDGKQLNAPTIFKIKDKKVISAYLGLPIDFDISDGELNDLQKEELSQNYAQVIES